MKISKTLITASFAENILKPLYLKMFNQLKIEHGSFLQDELLIKLFHIIKLILNAQITYKIVLFVLEL